MISSVHPPSNRNSVQFSGKKQQTQAKAGLVALLLGSAGAAATVQTPANALVLKGNQASHAGDSLQLALSHPKLSQQEMDAMIFGEPTTEAEAIFKEMADPADKKHRKLLEKTNHKSVDKKHHNDDNSVHSKRKLKQKNQLEHLSEAQAKNILLKAPFAPNNVNLFRQQTYAQSVNLPPAVDLGESEAQIKSSLLEALTRRFNGNTAKARNAARLFDDAYLKTLAPEAKVRAAMVNLQGTTGEPALEAYRNGTFGSVKFADLGPGVGISLSNPDGTGKPWVEVNSRYKGEDFQLLTHTMAHEALHQDQIDSLPEELIAYATTTPIYGKQVIENPNLAKQKSELPQRLNTALLAWFNSMKDGKPRIFDSNGNVFPGGKPLENFGAAVTVNSNPTGEFIFQGADTTAGNEVLRQMLERITQQDVPVANFDPQTESLLDLNQNNFKPTELVKLAEALELNLGTAAPTASPKPKPTAKGSAAPTIRPSAAPTGETTALKSTSEDTPVATPPQATNDSRKTAGRALLTLGLPAAAAKALGLF